MYKNSMYRRYKGYSVQPLVLFRARCEAPIHAETSSRTTFLGHDDTQN